MNHLSYRYLTWPRLGTYVCVLVGLLISQISLASPEAEQRMDVEDVLGAGNGQFVLVLRTQTTPVRYLPIWIGEVEAVLIRLRLDKQLPPRPMTLNLLEQVLTLAHIKVTQVAIDAYQQGVFSSKIHLKQNSKSWQMSARPSDAISLALSYHVPILVTAEILSNAGIDSRSLQDSKTPPNPQVVPKEDNNTEESL